LTRSPAAGRRPIRPPYRGWPARPPRPRGHRGKPGQPIRGGRGGGSRRRL
jgi:hypothetical protein